ncbi:MAG: DMT family transporter [Eubacterium sp.]|nr:DMT family transporter [Eubacterium sp.]
MNLKIRNSLLLLLTATIWGISFVSQSVGMDYLGPFTFNGLRLLMGGCVLIPVILIRQKHAARGTGGSRRGDLPQKTGSRLYLKGGVLCGICLFAASSLQQIGIQYTTAGKSGFITAFYIILVPVISLALGRNVSKVIWLAVAIALAGLYLISVKEGFSVGKGDFLTLLCAFVFAVHILVIDHYAPKTDGVRMACVQFFFAGALSMLFVLFLERNRFHLDAIPAAWLPLCYSGIFSAGIGYTLQIIGQEGLNPSVASLLMSMESCVSAVSGWLFLGQIFSVRERFGCVLMMAAIILADFLPFFSERGHSRHSRKSASGLHG